MAWRSAPEMNEIDAQYIVIVKQPTISVRTVDLNEGTNNNAWTTN